MPRKVKAGSHVVKGVGKWVELDSKEQWASMEGLSGGMDLFVYMILTQRNFIIKLRWKSLTLNILKGCKMGARGVN